MRVAFIAPTVDLSRYARAFGHKLLLPKERLGMPESHVKFFGEVDFEAPNFSMISDAAFRYRADNFIKIRPSQQLQFEGVSIGFPKRVSKLLTFISPFQCALELSFDIDTARRRPTNINHIDEICREVLRKSASYSPSLVRLRSLPPDPLRIEDLPRLLERGLEPAHALSSDKIVRRSNLVCVAILDADEQRFFGKRLNDRPIHKINMERCKVIILGGFRYDASSDKDQRVLAAAIYLNAFTHGFQDALSIAGSAARKSNFDISSFRTDFARSAGKLSRSLRYFSNQRHPLRRAVDRVTIDRANFIQQNVDELLSSSLSPESPALSSVSLDNYTFFISYARSEPDISYAIRLQQLIERQGGMAIRDDTDFHSSEALPEEMAKNISRSDFYLYVLSNNSSIRRSERVVFRELEHSRKIFRGLRSRRKACVSIEEVPYEDWPPDFRDGPRINFRDNYPGRLQELYDFVAQALGVGGDPSS